MNSISETMKKFITDIVKLIVDKPNEISVEVSTTTKSILIQVKSDKSDIGKIIGKTGRTIDALKLLSTVVKNTQFLGDTKSVFVEIIEDEKSNFLQNKNNR
jgi:predicted RNA-binding protein YlqC (UPF0109 family)